MGFKHDGSEHSAYGGGEVCSESRDDLNREQDDSSDEIDQYILVLL